MTKEPKLDSASRIVPEWTDYDMEIKTLWEEFSKRIKTNTVKPRSYGLHSYGILDQPDADIEYIFGKYHQNFYKIGTGYQF